MKSIKKLAIFFFMSLALVACSWDDESGDNPNGDNNNSGAMSFSVKVDGVNFQASTSPSVLIGGILSTSGSAMVLAGQGSTNWEVYKLLYGKL